MFDIEEYADQNGSSPFALWFAELDAQAAAKVTVFLTRLAQGNTSNVKRLQAGVLELKIDFGPGYRVYFGREGERLVILLGGGTKKRQQRDIENAVSRWADYRKRVAGKV
ncbi:MAG TPA: type II toxin-antitoxin system RelE/ParE family toxin [Bauldia sp.]|nr:type II toxin-antitoxin system RelE/ParE family toxin [Bauldia sp.]